MLDKLREQPAETISTNENLEISRRELLQRVAIGLVFIVSGCKEGKAFSKNDGNAAISQKARKKVEATKLPEGKIDWNEDGTELTAGNVTLHFAEGSKLDEKTRKEILFLFFSRFNFKPHFLIG